MAEMTTHDEDLRAELLELIARDDALRARLAADGSLFGGYHPEMAALHRDNATRLAAIVDEHGWPARSRVGEDAASAAWRIVQHAIAEPEFIRRMVPMIRTAVEHGEANASELAKLEDRIRVLEGRPQRYGTQFDWDEHGTAMVPSVGVEDPEGLDARREAVGLPPMRWRLPPPEDEPPPADPAARVAEYEAWLREVGWR